MGRKRVWDKVRRGHASFDEKIGRDWRIGPSESEFLQILPSDIKPTNIKNSRLNTGLPAIHRAGKPYISETIQYFIDNLDIATRNEFISAIQQHGFLGAVRYCRHIDPEKYKSLPYYEVNPPNSYPEYPPLIDCDKPTLLKRSEILKECSKSTRRRKRIVNYTNDRGIRGKRNK